MNIPKKHKICHDCGKTIVPPPDSISTGYGTDAEGHIVCFDCCGKRDEHMLEQMQVGDKCFLYLSQKEGKYSLSNWPGSLKIPVRDCAIGRHNMAGTRTDVWFSFHGNRFHGTQYGDFSQICHIRRIAK